MAADPKLSLCMIVRNEEANLPKSLGPVHQCFDEIVVVDTGSTDATVPVARSFGARTIGIQWPGDFAAARNVSLRAATGDWIMWLDADNYVSPEAVGLIRERLDNQPDRVLWCTEVVIPDGERLLQKRIFPRRPEVGFEGRVHEQLVHPDHFRSVLTPVEIFHWGYADKKSARQKGLRNLALLEQMAGDNPRDPYINYQLGRTLLNLRRFEAALGHMEISMAAGIDGGLNQGLFLHAHLLKARILDRMDQPGKAENVIESLVEAHPSYGPGHFFLGQMHYGRNRLNEAASAFRMFLQAGPGDPVAGLNPDRMKFTAFLLLGRCLEARGEKKDAENAYLESTVFNPENPEPYLELARLAEAQGDHLSSIGYLKHCLALSPGNRRAEAMLLESMPHG